MCGWMAAVGGMLAFGSFGVPIKSKVAQTLDIDPLAMQTYKTSMCFLTCWLVLLYGALTFLCIVGLQGIYRFIGYDLTTGFNPTHGC